MDQDNQVESAGALLVLDPDTERFFKAETGIQDTDELRKHIIQVQQEACKASRRLPGNGIPSRVFVLRSTRTLVFVGSDSRRSRLLGCPYIHAYSSCWEHGQTRYFWTLGVAVRIRPYLAVCLMT